MRFIAVLVGCAAFAAGDAAKLPVFRDVTRETGITYRTHSDHTEHKYLIESMVGGVALLDYNGDGYLDIYFVNGAALPPRAGNELDKSDPKYWNRLYRNNRDGTFEDVTVKAGVHGHSYGMGAAAADYDNDGDPDLYVTNYGRNILFRNNGDGTFSDVTEAAKVGGGGWSASAAWVDYNRDGRLDLVVSRYLVWDLQRNPWCGDQGKRIRAYCHPDVFQPIDHIVYRNDGKSFTDVTAEAGLKGQPGNGLGISFHDFDRDGWPDVLVANDARPQQLFRNSGKGTFEDVALESGLAFDEEGKTYSGMGMAFDDYDNDGWPDVFIPNLANQRYALYRNSKGTFEYVTYNSGVGRITQLHSGWGTAFVDLDNDGWKDLFVAQGHVMDNIEMTQPALRYLEPLLFMRNTRGRFIDVSAQSGPAFAIRMASRGVGFGDLDNDGFVDVVVNCNEGPPFVLKNGGNGNNWLTLELRGTKSNRDGIGAQVKLTTGSGAVQYGVARTAGSYQSSGDRRVHFGIGAETRVATVEIVWPSGIVQKVEPGEVNQVLRVTEPEGST